MENPWKSLLAVSLMSATATVFFCRQYITQEEQRQLIKKKKQTRVNIGGIFGMDIGGTLTKIVYFQTKVESPAELATLPSSSSLKRPVKRDSSDSLAQLDDPEHQAALDKLYSYLETESTLLNSTILTRDGGLSVYSRVLEGRLHFLHYETKNMIQAVNFLSKNALTENITSIGCTGGGAHKYAAAFHKELEIVFNKLDELGCLVRGMHFALTNFADECYTYRNKPDEPTDKDSVPISVKRWQKDVKEATVKVNLPYDQLVGFPYLVVNIGSGVSILKVSSPSQFERVSGSSVGGGTFWGLCRLLTKVTSFDEALTLAEKGDAGTVDMLVRDIYGGDYDGLLSGSLVAASFGKLVMKENPLEGVKEEDLILALLMTVINNIGQVAYMNAQIHNCSKIYFVGSFLRHNFISCRRLAFAIDFWSGNKMEALFLNHEGYYGALGTFLASAFGEDVDKILSTKKYQGEQVKKSPGSSAKLTSGSGRLTLDSASTESVDAATGQLEEESVSPLGKYISEQFARWRSKSFSSPESSEKSPADGSSGATSGTNSSSGSSLPASESQDFSSEDMAYKRKSRSSSDDYVLRTSRSPRK